VRTGEEETGRLDAIHQNTVYMNGVTDIAA
jgi:hypothetical protein